MLRLVRPVETYARWKFTFPLSASRAYRRRRKLYPVRSTPDLPVTQEVVGSNPAGPKFCFAPEHKLSVCAPSGVLLRLTPHNLQRTACPLGAQAGRPVFRHAPKLRFFSARGSVRTSCSAQELSDCRT